jgi:hypothetical protein
LGFVGGAAVKGQLITFAGKTQNLTAWSRETGIKLRTLIARFEIGWSVERVLTTPVVKVLEGDKA